MKWVVRLVWVALLAAGGAGLLVQPVPTGHAGRRGDAQLGPGLWFQVPWVWPVRVQPTDPPMVSPGATLPAAEAVARQVERLRAATLAIRSATEAEAEADRQAADAARAAQVAEEAAAERERAALLAEAHNTAAQALADAEGEAARRLGEVETHHAEALAEAELALAQAQAERDALIAAALARPGGRYFAALEAARRFRLGRLDIEARDPEFLKKFGSLAAWRRFFLED